MAASALPGDNVPIQSVPMVPIGRVRSPFHGKFGAPRQPGLVPAATGMIEFFPPFADPDALRGLDGFSHLWVIFLAHLIPAGDAFRPTVRPPRLGGNTRLGVFATRSLFRPNRIGLSLCRLDNIVLAPHPRLQVSGLDLADGTPVLDIKPYLPYADAAADARAGFATDLPTRVEVTIDPLVEPTITAREHTCPGFRDLLVQTIAADPRPAYHDGTRSYVLDLAGSTVHFRSDGDGSALHITAVEDQTTGITQDHSDQ